jgi:hypothetical protein
MTLPPHHGPCITGLHSTVEKVPSGSAGPHTCSEGTPYITADFVRGGAAERSAQLGTWHFAVCGFAAAASPPWLQSMPSREAVAFGRSHFDRGQGAFGPVELQRCAGWHLLAHGCCGVWGGCAPWGSFARATSCRESGGGYRFGAVTRDAGFCSIRLSFTLQRGRLLLWT